MNLMQEPLKHLLLVVTSTAAVSRLQSRRPAVPGLARACPVPMHAASASAGLPPRWGHPPMVDGDRFMVRHETFAAVNISQLLCGAVGGGLAVVSASQTWTWRWTTWTWTGRSELLRGPSLSGRARLCVTACQVVTSPATDLSGCVQLWSVVALTWVGQKEGPSCWTCGFLHGGRVGRLLE